MNSKKSSVYDGEDFASLRKVGKLAARTLDYIADFVAKGVTTLELNNLCDEFINSNGGIAACKGYRGFPESVCISVNHVVCHGIPSEKKVLKDGDILNIDVTVILDGYYGDTSRMFYVGTPSVKAKRLCEVAEESLRLGIEQVKPGNHIGDIGFVIENFVKNQGFSVVREYCGHGIGKIFHDNTLQICHFGKKGTGDLIEKGMVFTIEPMVNAGDYRTILNKIDGWTVTTRDKSLSAQYEHTLGVTDEGAEIFTLSTLAIPSALPIS
ncbi:MAG: type I methionyl aminopeptidase [Rickettsiales bacterium]|jgi:methionyl aminopeptidase|nr:type I methionyl aminopeptidase [Rickettsiales bacterium]